MVVFDDVRSNRIIETKRRIRLLKRDQARLQYLLSSPSADPRSKTQTQQDLADVTACLQTLEDELAEIESTD